MFNSLHSISTIMHIKFEHVQDVDDKVIFQTRRKCCKNFNQRELIDKFQVYQTGDDKVTCMLQTKNYSNKFSNSRANNSTCSGLITPIIKLIQDLRVIYILTNFGTNWLIFVDATM